MESRVVHVNIEDEIRKSYLEYALSVIIGRALPDVRDGLKPVHRRILFAMSEAGNDYNKPYKKSARIVGDVIGKYHPHGDTAVYDAIVRMAQDFSLRYPLVDGQGNFGSIDGDAPAAMRYTEVRMTRLAGELLLDLDKETVDFIPNYDGSMQEPLVLPARAPNLLINGSSGIAVGMATNIPPHNLAEVCNALLAFIKNPQISLAELMAIMPGPDFPTAGFIYGSDGIAEAYRTGKGLIRLRARTFLEQRGGREYIIINELPYQVNKVKLIERIVELVKDKKIEGITDIRDESDREGMRVVIQLRKDELAQPILNQLFAHTNMQVTYGINLVAIVNNRPELLSLKDLLTEFLKHRREVIVRRTLYELRKAEERAHILAGLKIALDHLDQIIALIRSAASPSTARSQLVERFTLTEVQAQAILEMRLQRLTGLERQKIIDEYEQLLKDIARFKEILANEALVYQLIEADLIDLRDRYGDPRRTEIIPETAELTLEDLIPDEDMVVTVSHQGYIKRNPLNLYRSQRRGGKGRTGMSIKEDDFVSQLYIASTHNYFLVFSNLGRIYWLKVHEIPVGSPSARGKAIVNLLNFGSQEKLTTILPIREFVPEHYLVMATKRGIIKKTELMNFSRPRSGGLIACTLDEGDELVSVALTDGNKEVFLGTSLGKIIRFAEQDVRDMGRSARGVRGMTVAEDDCIVGMEILSAEGAILTVTANGYGKRTRHEEYRLQKRGGSGLLALRITDRNGPVVGIIQVTEDDEIMLITDRGKIIRLPVTGISLIGRVTQGVKLIDTEPEERVVSIARLAEKGDEGE
ncbi:DNA gyrase subunit A [Desulfobacca acetoxidans]|uniref:DNA gyrase subunit A n=1 Tax=Desulfobacca acetoxidans (strain ATCC 700848 / DSM 11109 / ASRB2) TaxID=880072 RepID=F2NCU3_DESAR|nr:DNA gyrase subunit A [Desulfobacca acetoxidans]AEB09374.1 DNA gyrase, A subunit [Desulfobacca acetoxidans DSM 11109]